MHTIRIINPISIASQKHSNKDSVITFMISEGKMGPDECTPLITNGNLGKSVSIDGKPLNPNAVALPCGLRAASFLNVRLFTVRS